jgi:thiol peroxidase
VAWAVNEPLAPSGTAAAAAGDRPAPCWSRPARQYYAGRSRQLSGTGDSIRWIDLPEKQLMSRKGAVTFKGTPLTLAGQAVAVGQQAPDFTLHYFDGGLKTLKLSDLRGKPVFLSVVPSLDTPVCQVQTKNFNKELAALGDRVHAVTVSLDLPFAMNRFCGAEDIKHMRVASDYQDRAFGKNWGMLIEELKLLARGVFVLDSSGKVVYAETVGEVAHEPNYGAALAALKALL